MAVSSIKEVWKDIDGYDGFYQISNMGKVKSIGKKANKILILKEQKKRGYCVVNLYNEFGMKSKTVHRLVAKAFLPNEDNKPHVNHIDYNRANNKLDNLEWNTVKENVRHSYKNTIGNSLKQIMAINSKGLNKKSVFMMDLNGNVLREFLSMSEASINMCGKVTATIGNHIANKNIRKSAYGYTWAYK